MLQFFIKRHSHFPWANWYASPLPVDQLVINVYTYVKNEYSPILPEGPSNSFVIHRENLVLFLMLLYNMVRVQEMFIIKTDFNK